MRIAILLALTSSAAAETSFSMVGLGSSYAAEEPGWMLRTEMRQDLADDDGVVFGSRLGLEFWQSASHTGFSVPLGMYWGAQVDDARMTLGGGVGLWNIEYHGHSAYHGVAPFVSSSVELHREKLLVSLDVRLSRSVVTDADDINVYSFMLMVGK